MLQRQPLNSRTQGHFQPSKSTTCGTRQPSNSMNEIHSFRRWPSAVNGCNASSTPTVLGSKPSGRITVTPTPPTEAPRTCPWCSTFVELWSTLGVLLVLAPAGLTDCLPNPPSEPPNHIAIGPFVRSHLCRQFSMTPGVGRGPHRGSKPVVLAKRCNDHPSPSRAV